MACLLRIVINAILYATSASVTSDVRSPRRPDSRGQKHRARNVTSGETVYYLPGTIDIRRVREMQTLERVSTGRAMFARFLVLGTGERIR
ncbi:MAG: hypothetical protein WCJ30_01345 [Deltaproteobacteria bacterium]